MKSISKEARETIEIWRKEIHMETAIEIMIELGLNYGHPEVIKEIQDSKAEVQMYRTKISTCLIYYQFCIYWQNIAGFKNQLSD